MWFTTIYWHPSTPDLQFYQWLDILEENFPAGSLQIWREDKSVNPKSILGTVNRWDDIMWKSGVTKKLWNWLMELKAVHVRVRTRMIQKPRVVLLPSPGLLDVTVKQGPSFVISLGREKSKPLSNKLLAVKGVFGEVSPCFFTLP